VLTFDAASISRCSKSGAGSAVAYINILAPGVCGITVTYGASGIYNAVSGYISFTIGKTPQSQLTMSASPTSLTYNPNTPASITISATYGSLTTSNPKTFSVSPSSASICSINETTGVLTALGAGLCQVYGNVAGNDTYADLATLYNVNIAKASQAAVTLSANRTTYQASDSDALVVTAAGGSGTGAYTYTTSTTSVCSIDAVTGVVTGKTFGTCTVTATRAADSNFNSSSASAGLNISISKLAQATFTASSTTTSTVYGGASFTVSSSGGSGNGAVTYSSSNTSICSVVSATVGAASTAAKPRSSKSAITRSSILLAMP
jgi:hypothetical protein